MNETVVRPHTFEKFRTSYKVVLVPIQILVVPCYSKSRAFKKQAYGTYLVLALTPYRVIFDFKELSTKVLCCTKL